MLFQIIFLIETWICEGILDWKSDVVWNFQLEVWCIGKTRFQNLIFYWFFRSNRLISSGANKRNTFCTTQKWSQRFVPEIVTTCTTDCCNACQLYNQYVCTNVNTQKLWGKVTTVFLLVGQPCCWRDTTVKTKKRSSIEIPFFSNGFSWTIRTNRAMEKCWRLHTSTQMLYFGKVFYRFGWPESLIWYKVWLSVKTEKVQPAR